MTKLTGALAATALISVGQLAQAEGSSGFTIDLEIETNAVSTFSADDPTAEFTDVNAEVTLVAEVELGGGFSIFSEVLLETVVDPTDDVFFDNHGLFVSEIGLAYANDNFSVAAGKISPAFGLAWDAAPGFFGADVAEDYELGDSIGAAVEVPFNLAGGEHSISAAVFYLDTTLLSRSIITKRGRTTTADGGAGNTEKLDNFALQFAGAFGDTEYNLSFRQLSAGEGDVDDDRGASFGLQHSFGNFTALGEVARFENFNGTADDVTYGTLGGSYTMNKWTFSGSYTARDGVADASDYLASVGVDYDFGNDLVASFGLSQFEEADQKSNSVALSLYKAFSFGG
ncbi:porin [Amylibacter sp. SFDW26]|uniref:porin n=1 Tax=Amylibacter sp. SFDW26 TaxID=2652722 RepID=UPI001261CC48|nr:porin [Amylibacter sp. SFDW26]KAB7615196.1 porin [Amylibacter sp. SFDW26]